MDLMPTFVELGGGNHPVTPDSAGPDGKGSYKGRRGVLPMTGKSWTSWVQGKESAIHGENTSIGWELHGRAAFRRGNWKIVYMREHRT